MLGDAEVVISPDGPAYEVWKRSWPRLQRHLAGPIDVKTAERGTFKRLIYRRTAAGIEDTGIRAAGRILEHGPLPMAIIGWLLRFPYFGGALQRLSGLVIFIYRSYRGIIRRKR